MQKLIKRVLALILLTTTLSAVSAQAGADEKKPASEAPAKGKKAARSSFKGHLTAIDKTAMTFTVEGKNRPSTLHVTSRTRISKAGKPATFGDAAIGDVADGQAIKNAADEEEAVTLRLGAKSKAKPEKKKEPKTAAPKKE